MYLLKNKPIKVYKNKKMKRKIKKISLCATILFGFYAQHSQAQTEKGAYVTATTGYSAGTGSANFAAGFIFQIYNGNEISASDGTTGFAKLNLGEGLNAGVAFGYNITKNIGFEIGANYLIGENSASAFKSYTGDYRNNEMSATMIQLKPSVVFRAGFDKINPYAKVGMLIGSGKIILDTDYQQGANSAVSTFEFSEGLPIGFQGSLGTLYSINEKFTLFGELAINNLTYSPKKGKYTKFYANGENILPGMSVKSKEIIFVESYNTSAGSSPDNEPDKQFLIPFSFSSIGVNVGLQYHF